MLPFPELEDVTPGNAPYTLALHALMTRLTALRPSGEQQALMTRWNGLRNAHLDALHSAERQDHAQVLTPVIAVGVLELSSLVLGGGLGLMTLIIARLAHADWITALMLMIGVAAVVSAGLNQVLVRSRMAAFERVRKGAEQHESAAPAGEPERENAERELEQERERELEHA